MTTVEVSITQRGDVGGFDVGSKFSWQVLGALDYEISDQELSLGAEWSVTRHSRLTTRKEVGLAVTNMT